MMKPAKEEVCVTKQTVSETFKPTVKWTMWNTDVDWKGNNDMKDTVDALEFNKLKSLGGDGSANGCQVITRNEISKFKNI